VDDFNDDGVLTTELFLTKVGGVTFESRLLKDWKVLDGSQVDLHLIDFNGNGKADIISQEKYYWDNNDILTASILTNNVETATSALV